MLIAVIPANMDGKLYGTFALLYLFFVRRGSRPLYSLETSHVDGTRKQLNQNKNDSCGRR
jgi:hypothetical protein